MGAACGIGGGGRDMAWLLDAAFKILKDEGATYFTDTDWPNNMRTTTASGKCCCVQCQSQQ